MHQREIGTDRLLQHELLSHTLIRKSAHLLGRGGLGDLTPRPVPHRQPTLGHLGPHPGGSEERRNPTTPGPQLLRQRALRGQLHLQLPRQVLPLEVLVLPHIGGRHLRKPPPPQQQPHPVATPPAVGPHTPQPPTPPRQPTPPHTPPTPPQ